MGLALFEAGRCECDWPIEVAWHADMEGWFDGNSYVCHACSARQGREVVHTLKPTTGRDFRAKPLSDFDWKTTTTPPKPREDD